MKISLKHLGYPDLVLPVKIIYYDEEIMDAPIEKTVNVTTQKTSYGLSTIFPELTDIKREKISFGSESIVDGETYTTTVAIANTNSDDEMDISEINETFEMGEENVVADVTAGQPIDEPGYEDEGRNNYLVTKETFDKVMNCYNKKGEYANYTTAQKTNETISLIKSDVPDWAIYDNRPNVLTYTRTCNFSKYDSGEYAGEYKYIYENFEGSTGKTNQYGTPSSFMAYSKNHNFYLNIVNSDGTTTRSTINRCCGGSREATILCAGSNGRVGGVYYSNVLLGAGFPWFRIKNFSGEGCGVTLQTGNEVGKKNGVTCYGNYPNAFYAQGLRALDSTYNDSTIHDPYNLGNVAGTEVITVNFLYDLTEASSNYVPPSGITYIRDLGENATYTKEAYDAAEQKTVGSGKGKPFYRIRLKIGHTYVISCAINGTQGGGKQSFEAWVEGINPENGEYLLYDTPHGEFGPYTTLGPQIISVPTTHNFHNLVTFVVIRGTIKNDKPVFGYPYYLTHSDLKFVKVHRYLYNQAIDNNFMQPNALFKDFWDNQTLFKQRKEKFKFQINAETVEKPEKVQEYLLDENGYISATKFDDYVDNVWMNLPQVK